MQFTIKQNLSNSIKKDRVSKPVGIGQLFLQGPHGRSTERCMAGFLYSQGAILSPVSLKGQELKS